MAAPPPPVGSAAAAAQMRAWSQPSSIAATPPPRELGELFEYRISTPVTIRKSESAMLPFLQHKITARKLLIYSDQSSAHPMNAAEITNSTGKTLDGGPITVFDAGAYARRSADGNGQDRRQTADQLRRRSRHAHHHAVRFQRRRGPRSSHAARRVHHAHGRRRNQDLHHPQRGSESQDADHRASARARNTRCSNAKPRRKPRMPIASK